MNSIGLNELSGAAKMEQILSGGRNILLTEKHVVSTDFHGVVHSGLTPALWLDFFQQNIANRKKASNTAAAHYTTDFAGQPFRCCLANSLKGWCITMRALPLKIPALRDDLGLDWNVIRPLTEGSGLTLFAGRMNSGKSTTMAATIGQLDPLVAQIATVEDPVEFAYPHPSIIQREIGSHVDSFPEAIRDCVRQNRGTIVVSEIRDSETACAAVMAASTGHSVYATIHADNLFDIYTRMLALVEPRLERVLARSIRGLWWQQVVRFGTEDRKPLPIYESLVVDTAARHIFEKGTTSLPMLANVMATQQRKTMAEVAMSYVGAGMATRDELNEFIVNRNRINNL